MLHGFSAERANYKHVRRSFGCARHGAALCTLGNNVMVGAGAKILGAFEVGDNCSIAANAVLLKPLEDNVTAVGIPARPVKKDGVTLPKRKETMTLEEYETMKERMLQMEEEIRQLKEKLNKQ